LQGAWSLLLHSHSGAQDVMLGVVAAGRPAELRDVESIVGSFVTNLPVRILLPGDSSIGAWLAGIQQQSRARLPFEYVSLSQIQRWSGSAGHDSLFDTLMVWLNGSAAPVFSGLELELLSHGMGTVFPLSLYVDESSDCLELVAELGENHEAVTPLQELLAELGRFLSLLASSDQQATLATLPGFRGNRGAADLVPSAPPEVAVSEVVATAATEVVVGREQPERELLQELVAGHWCTILGLSEIPADGDFFELGGDSLKATSLAESLQQALGREIPVLAIFRRPTIAGMAEVILDRDWPSVARVAMPVRTGGSMPPLFCVASPEVDTVGYAVLARHLCAERPVYVLQSPPSAARVRRLQPPEIPVLAANYLAAIREIQPQGPYHLLGMCSGSQIEMEICRALAEQGDTIGFWGVLDTWALFTLSRRYYVKKMLDLGRYYLSRVRALRSMDGGRRAQAVQRVASRHLAGTGLAEEPAPASGAAESESRAYTLVEEIGWPHEQPDRPKIRSRVTVFRQRRRQQYWRVRDAALGWARHAESVEVVHLAAPSHKTIFKEPYTADLAHLIESRLSEH
jgi:syringomycin synthetase protein SyrE